MPFSTLAYTYFFKDPMRPNAIFRVSISQLNVIIRWVCVGALTNMVLNLQTLVQEANQIVVSHKINCVQMGSSV